MNDGFMSTRDVSFRADTDNKALVPCLTRSQLATMGVNTRAVPGMAILASEACVPLTSLIKEASTDFDVGRQRLSVQQQRLDRLTSAWIHHSRVAEYGHHGCRHDGGVACDIPLGRCLH
jgi:outer membrane usher protein FimD/PapC